MHGAVGLGHALDGGDLGAGHLGRQDVARLDGAAVDVDGAGAALGGVAADVGAGEVEVLADRVHEEGVGWRVDGDRAAVDPSQEAAQHEEERRTRFLVHCRPLMH